MKFSYFLGIIFICILVYIVYYGVVKNNKKNSIKSIVAALNTETTEYPLSIVGAVPEWIKGTFVRNGPIPVQINHQKIAHWFDGPAMLHAFSFQNGQVLYSNKFLKTDVYEKIFKEGNLNYEGFASQAKESLLEKIKALFKRSTSVLQNANVNVAKIANNYTALTETPLPVCFDIKTLDTLGALQFQDNLPKKDIFESVHIQQDKNTDEQINYLVQYGRKSKYVIYRLSQDKPYREVISEIEVEKPSYMHSFALTQNYIILVEFPLRVNPLDLLLMNKPFIKNFKWYKEEGTQFIIINRKTGTIVKKIQDNASFFAFHHVNAYETSDSIILDIITYPNADVISNFSDHEDLNEPYFEKKEDQEKTRLMRYAVSLKENTLQSDILWDIPIEFPRINELYAAKQHRYIYAVDPRLLQKSGDLRPIYKIDTQLQTKDVWQEPGLLPGEPVFISNPNKREEDDGALVSIVLDPIRKKAFLLILDAKSFKEIGRLYAPHPIPLGLHGQFFNP